MGKFYIQTYGCQMNYSDTERMESYLQALGYDKAPSFEEADLIMFNTCSIRQSAEDRVYGHMRTIEQMRRQHKKITVVITGCMVRKSSSRYSSERDKLFNTTRELDIALRTEELPKLAALARELDPESKIPEIKEESLEDYFKISPTHSSHQSKAQAFVAISNGCDKFCTYCIVPYSRGREKSRDIQEILKECTQLVENGCKEITLIGQTVNSYGLSQYDKEEKTFEFLGEKEPFIYLLEEIDKLHAKGLVRLSFTSSHPKDMSDQLIEAMANLKTIMPYLHLPVQAGDNRTLKRMNRTYTVEHYRKIIEKLRKAIPGISISTDIIVGFCGETDEEFENTYKFFDEMDFEHGYISQYSERTGTTAARFIKDDISEAVKQERWNKLNDNLLRAKSKKAHERFLGKVVNVLVESQEGKKCLGRSEHFKTVQFQSGRKLLGEIVPVKITKAMEWILEGKLV
ncbi:tRNA (N6-isopentenyl adenosine(37)-C2)-methylthiotransferase MiaB [Candidatus Gracilibacteria bacterium]|nr:tRNA (N6-isopentenyl adenosine(37)-C2)-methylthiotransferase MiaB [Candidatus Gracilibacteria bacterium]